MKVVCLIILSAIAVVSFSAGYICKSYFMDRKKGQVVAEALVLYGYTSAKQNKSVADTLSNMKDFIPSN